jgi:hypothetical protein
VSGPRHRFQAGVRTRTRTLDRRPPLKPSGARGEGRGIRSRSRRQRAAVRMAVGQPEEGHGLSVAGKEKMRLATANMCTRRVLWRSGETQRADQSWRGCFASISRPNRRALHGGTSVSGLSPRCATNARERECIVADILAKVAERVTRSDAGTIVEIGRHEQKKRDAADLRGR